MRRSILFALFAAWITGGPFTIPILSATTIGSVSTYGVFESGSVEIVLSGYDVNDRNETARGWIKAQGAPDPEYREFHPFVRYDGNHMVTSLFDLESNRAYAVIVQLTDPDMGIDSAFTTLTTRPEYQLPAPSREISVNSSGSLRAAIDDARPGDHIRIDPGDYFDTIEIAWISGTEQNPIVLTASDSTRKPHFYRGIQAYLSSHVVLDKLEVEAIDPNDDRVTNPVPLGYGGIDLRGCHHIVITDCYIHDCDEEGASGGYKANIFVEHNDENEGTDKNGYFLILNNVIADEVHPGWPWDDDNSCGETPGQTYVGIKFDFRPGGFNVIRGNTIYGCVDGISSGGDEGWYPPDPGDTDVLADYPNQNVDIYDNVIYHNRDDAIELDGHTVNGRVYRNHIGECMNAISTAPVYPGPIFILRNTIGGFKENVSKLNTGVDGVTRNAFWYHNTAVQPEFQEKQNRWCIYRGMPGFTEDLVYKNNIFTARSILIDSDISGYHRNHRYDYNNVYSYRSYMGETYSGSLYIWGENVGDRQYYDTFEAFQAGTGQETHGIYGEPSLDGTTGIEFRRPDGYLSDECYPENYFLYRFSPMAGSPGIDRAEPIPGINDDYTGSAPDCGAAEYEFPAGIEGGGRPVGSAGIPRVFSLSQNYPNPFNPSTTIEFSVPAVDDAGGKGDGAARVVLKVYDARGRFVRSLVDGEKAAGSYKVHWDGRDVRGGPVASGIYIYSLRAGTFKSTKKMLVVR